MTNLTMSLDGFIAGPNDGPGAPFGHGGERLFDWYSSGDTEFTMPDGEMTFSISAVSVGLLDEATREAGALVTGRKTFNIANGWSGRHPVDVPVFVLTHTVPEDWVYEGSPFTFVTDGVESAVEQAKAVAGDKDVGVGAASIAQQCIRAGLLDEVLINLVPVLLGDGVRLFDLLGIEPIQLENIRVVEGTGVTHLHFRVIK
ncbi:MAG: dihydrofolate reductase family protein [Actinomycetota bacterium]|nr:dihydrofolate reductase family protein [Actinomycetota bacterium]